MMQMEKLDLKDAAQEEDLKHTQQQIRQLSRMLEQIKRKQNIERHQLSLHSAVNAHSHSRVVLSSLIETIIYMAVTAFQVYIIKKWFKGSPMLGR